MAGSFRTRWSGRNRSLRVEPLHTSMNSRTARNLASGRPSHSGVARARLAPLTAPDRATDSPHAVQHVSALTLASRWPGQGRSPAATRGRRASVAP